jgi:phosphomannomutase
MISALAADRGVVDVRTLTGFKWVSRPIVDRPDHRYLFGYEEALGYCVGDRVRDKDGISAALVMAELVAATRAAGRTLWDILDDLAVRYGVHRTGPVTIRFEGGTGLDRRAALMAEAVADPPAELAGVPVVATEDLSEGHRLPPTTGVIWDLADRSRVIIRPSGTEPKLKAYIEVIEPVGAPRPEAEPIGTGDGEEGSDDRHGGSDDQGALVRAGQRASSRLEALRRAVASRLR